MAGDLENPHGWLSLQPVDYFCHFKKAFVMERVNKLVVAEPADKPFNRGINVFVAYHDLIPILHQFLAD